MQIAQSPAWWTLEHTHLLSAVPTKKIEIKSFKRPGKEKLHTTDWNKATSTNQLAFARVRKHTLNDTYNFFFFFIRVIWACILYRGIRNRISFIILMHDYSVFSLFPVKRMFKRLEYSLSSPYWTRTFGRTGESKLPQASRNHISHGTPGRERGPRKFQESVFCYLQCI